MSFSFYLKICLKLHTYNVNRSTIQKPELSVLQLFEVLLFGSETDSSAFCHQLLVGEKKEHSMMTVSQQKHMGWQGSS